MPSRTSALVRARGGSSPCRLPTNDPRLLTPLSRWGYCRTVVRTPAGDDRERSAMPCPRCRHEDPASSRFCTECGARLAPSCSSCGAELAEGVRFCGACGLSVEAQRTERARLDPAFGETDRSGGGQD